MRPATFVLVLGAAALLAGCELFGFDSGEKIAALREADGKAIGSACRHAGRAIEDCYVLNPKAQRPAVFAGWREMDEYMRDNKLDTVVPVLARPGSMAAEVEVPAAPAPAMPADDAKAVKGKLPGEESRPAKGKPAVS